eukprot:scaffold8878_cov27-Tisochrysis_lutea.AAC.3
MAAWWRGRRRGHAQPPQIAAQRTHPSANRDEALWKTLAASTLERKASAAAGSSVTITSVCDDP